MKVKSDQPDIVAMHKGNPSYEIEFGSEPVEVNEEVGKHLISTNSHFSLAEESNEPEVKEINLDYKTELEKIKGIGKKTAKDIMTMFRTKESLVEAIKRGDHLSFQDDIVELLKKQYGGKK